MVASGWRRALCAVFGVAVLACATAARADVSVLVRDDGKVLVREGAGEPRMVSPQDPMARKFQCPGSGGRLGAADKVTIGSAPSGKFEAFSRAANWLSACGATHLLISSPTTSNRLSPGDKGVVDLPFADTTPLLPRPCPVGPDGKAACPPGPLQTLVAVRADGTVYISVGRPGPGGTTTPSRIDLIGQDLRPVMRSQNPTTDRFYLRVDRDVTFAQFYQVVSALSAGGYSGVSLIQEEL